MNVLIADDSDLMRERLVSMLSELPDIEIIGQARDGMEAIELIQTLKPDLVILDVRMPGRNGIAVLKRIILKRIKRDARSPKVSMFTNYPYPQYRIKCLKAGADFFFDKSVDFEQLVHVLNTLVQETHKTPITFKS